MCIVIDINTLAPVFNTNSREHTDFAPVKRWIEEGKGFVVYGGTKYKQELKKTGTYLNMILELRRGGRAIPIKDTEVDALEAEVNKKTHGTQCDDQHIIALLGASRCSLLCSKDERSFTFVQDRSLYPRGMKRVKIYKSAKHISLLRKTSRNSLVNVE